MSSTTDISLLGEPNSTVANGDSLDQGARASLKDHAYERLRLEIITFGLKPGERVSESQIAERFDIGIAAVRAALPRLVQEGLVINRRRLGHLVAPITVQDIRDIYELRAVLEPAAAELAVGRLDPRELEKLDVYSSMPVAPGDRDGEVAALFANREFHDAICAATGNERMRVMIRQLHDLSIRFQYLLRHAREHDEEWRGSHKAIIAAFERGDRAAVRDETLEHIRRGQQLMMDALMELPEVRTINIGGAEPER
jgi:DNA-binding GntR family transcriptional regulator